MFPRFFSAFVSMLSISSCDLLTNSSSLSLLLSGNHGSNLDLGQNKIENIIRLASKNNSLYKIVLVQSLKMLF